jgi:hypothetical protein
MRIFIYHYFFTYIIFRDEVSKLLATPLPCKHPGMIAAI